MITAAAGRLRPRHYLLLGLFAVLLQWPGRASLPPTDRDESRYLEASAQMLETHDWVDVRFQDQPRYLQPAGIYWLEAAAVAATGQTGSRNPWAYRLPSLIGAVGSVLVTGWIGAALFGPAAGLAAGALLAGSVLLEFEGHVAKIDATLLLVTLIAQAALLRIRFDAAEDRPDRRGPAMVYWAALGCGLMLKGPLILLVAWGTLLGLWILDRHVSWMRRLHAGWGLALMLAIVLPWCIAIAIVSHGDFFARSVGHNLLGKVASGQEAHGQPPGFHLALLLPAFWPGSLFAVLAVPYVWAQRRQPAIRLLIAWIVPAWLVFELIATKLPHYVLPTYPAIACLASAAAFAPQPWRFGRVWRAIAVLYSGFWFAFSTALALAGPVLLWRLESRVCWLPILVAPLVVALAVWVLASVWRSRPDRAISAALVMAVLVGITSFGAVLPRLRTIWLSPRIAAAIADVRPCPNSVIASSSFSEPSLVFLAGEHTQLVDAAGSAAWLAADPACHLALIGQRDDAAFRARLAAIGLAPPHELARIAGINYSNGRRLDLALYGAAARR